MLTTVGSGQEIDWIYVAQNASYRDLKAIAHRLILKRKHIKRNVWYRFGILFF